MIISFLEVYYRVNRHAYKHGGSPVQCREFELKMHEIRASVAPAEKAGSIEFNLKGADYGAFEPAAQLSRRARVRALMQFYGLRRSHFSMSPGRNKLQTGLLRS